MLFITTMPWSEMFEKKTQIYLSVRKLIVNDMSSSVRDEKKVSEKIALTVVNCNR